MIRGKRTIRCLGATVGALAWLLVAAAAAGAAEYVVTSTGDQVDEALGSGGCKTAAATCTLRAAIEESNASTGIEDTIKFNFLFDGEVGDTIELATPLPTITDQAQIRGFPSPQPCETAYNGFPGPCVGINGPPGGTTFRVAAERVILNGFAITGSKTAVEAVNAPLLRAWNIWIGLKLDGNAGPVETGMSFDQGSDGANLGGVSSLTRILFAHNTGVGLDVNGADATLIRGSGFGVLPDGTWAAPNGTNIEITDAASGDERVAKHTWIGDTLTEEQLASQTCDGPCNVIAAATETGIDLQGDDPDEKPATGATLVAGNYIGLNAFGNVSLPNTLGGVLVGGAENVTVGGPQPGDRNLISGGAYGVRTTANAGYPRIENNWIGLAPSGAATIAPPTDTGIAIEGGYNSEVTSNRIAMTGGTAIEQRARDTLITANTIGEGPEGQPLPGGSVGIHLADSYEALVEDNAIANAVKHGVLIESGWNFVYGNRIESSGAAGIRIQGPSPSGSAFGNLVGGNVPARENRISSSGGPAIEIIEGAVAVATRNNVVARNRGALNTGLFIDLVDGANEDIPAPPFSTATQAGASGEGAEGQAVIRIFRKATPATGEIESFLAETVANGSGEWEVTYPSPIPAGTIVAATQSEEEDWGTSELSFATTAADEKPTPPEEEPVSKPPAPAPLLDTTAPQTFIAKGPKPRSPSRTASFRFGATEFATFACKLDTRVIATCAPPRTYRNLTPGRHVFRVWATDAAGNADPTPAKWTFRILPRPSGPS